MTENKYQIAQEVVDEWEGLVKEEFPGNFPNWLKDKAEPKDEMFEKFKEWEDFALLNATKMDSVDRYQEFKRLFPELNGVRGLDYGKLKKIFREFMATFNVRGQSMPNATIINLSNWLVDLVEGEIKSRLEGRE